MKHKTNTKDLFKANDGIRINKHIADSGYCSRRKADEIIASGVVKVNRKTAATNNAKSGVSPKNELQSQSS